MYDSDVRFLVNLLQEMSGVLYPLGKPLPTEGALCTALTKLLTEHAEKVSACCDSPPRQHPLFGTYPALQFAIYELQVCGMLNLFSADCLYYYTGVFSKKGRGTEKHWIDCVEKFEELLDL